MILLDEKKIRTHLRTQLANLFVLDTVGSTNDYLKAQPAIIDNPSVCIAEQQLKGRGRLGRQWYSPFGENLYFSLAYRFKKPLQALGGLSLVVGLAVCRAICDTVLLAEDKLKLKWPNDIVVDDKKLAGILVEVHASSEAMCHIVIGVGINVNMSVLAEGKVSQPWTSIRHLTSCDQDRNILCANLINVLADYLARFDLRGFSSFKMAWHQKDYLIGKSIQVRVAGKLLEGTCLGVDVHGNLLLQAADDVTHVCASGEATLVK